MKVRADFPILDQQVNGRPLVYLDSAASAQRPRAVLAAVEHYETRLHSNVHRGVHTLSQRATEAYEGARETVRRFINARSTREIVFVRGTTEAINLVAQSWGRNHLRTGDEILITQLEHHANIVPWQILQAQLGFTLRYVPITDHGTLDLRTLPDLLTPRTRLFSFVHASNVVGTVNPVQELVAAARAVGAAVLIDGAQSAPHMPVDVQALDADFFVFSSHKMCGPTGIGVLYGKRELLEAMPPFMGGGDMIREVTMTGSKWNTVPYKFEAGTPSIAEAIGLGAAVDYLQQVGMAWIQAHERAITQYAYTRMAEVEGLHILGPAPDARGGLVAFTLEGVHPHDLSAILDRSGVAVRAGHHCAQPLHDRLGIHASARASFYLYNTLEEVDVLVQALHKAQEIFTL